MESTKISENVQKLLHDTIRFYPAIENIVKKIHALGGRAFLVGGAVRDLLLGLSVKDLDIEVHGMSLEALEKVLRAYGPVSLVGKSFGVLRLHGLDVDWSLPRKDSAGRKPKVQIDPSMSLEDAFRRRDLTINAMGIDLVTLELVDPFGGQDDLKRGFLRATDEHFFIEDPLRFFRVMQFVGRFQMVPDDRLNSICKAMDVSTVSRERIEQEFAKLFLKSKCPSLGFKWLREIGRLADVLPEVAALIGVPQHKGWHPEGDVFEHTMQAVDAAAALEYESDYSKLVMMYAALCHDLGKVVTTEKINGVWKSLEHAQEGVPLAKKLLKRITYHKQLIDAVCKLVKYHMLPVQFIDNRAKSSAYKRLANKLAPEVTLQMLGRLSLIDKRARNPERGKPLVINDESVERFLRKAESLKVLVQAEEPILLGRDLLDVVEPGPKMGKLLKRAYEIQLEEGVRDKDELKRRVLE